jgi:hypothetical protein
MNNSFVQLVNLKAFVAFFTFFREDKKSISFDEAGQREIESGLPLPGNPNTQKPKAH